MNPVRICRSKAMLCWCRRHYGALWLCFFFLLGSQNNATGFGPKTGSRRPTTRVYAKKDPSPSSDEAATTNLQELHARARDVRTHLGHDVARPLYQQILQLCPSDRTAGTRLAASPSTKQRHEEACPLFRQARIRDAKDWLLQHGFTHQGVASFLRVPTREEALSCEGPLFVTPVAPGAVTTSNYPLEQNPSGLACLVALFLLGLVVPQESILQALGPDSSDRLQQLGWAFPCETDPSLLVPYVHVFPIDFYHDQSTTTLHLVTDLHPRVTSTISIGNNVGNAVMYIGPDSLALAQHFNPYQHLMENTQGDTFRILDLGTGSGVQALAALQHWKLAAHPTSDNVKAVAVDVNPRALRFAVFNAVLNGLDEHLSVVQANLLDYPLENRIDTQNVVLANPPFLPVPNNNDDVVDSIQSRYGLFSSGGPSGEDVLERIVQLAGHCLAEGGLLAVVSEFFVQTHDPSFQRIQSWWGSSSSMGVLLINEHPIDAETYATRRADNAKEQEAWLQHLQSLKITLASPGLLYVQKEGQEEESGLDLDVLSVPKTQKGSIWTPSNEEAIRFTQKAMREVLGWPPE